MLGRKTALSGTLMVMARLISRVVDLGAMLVMAHVLSPSDFGFVAIAMTLVLISEAALELPLGQALVCLPEIKTSYYDTAFTLGLVRAALLCVIICSIAVPFALFYHQSRLAPLICVLSIAPAARGLGNPRMAQFAKDLNFKWEFYFELVGKVSAAAIGITAAVLTRSYWSIALVTVAAPVIIAILSYFVMPFRPKLTFADWHVFSNFLGWISLSQVVMTVNWQSDQLLLGKLMRPSQLGLFSTANNVTSIPMLALFSPIQRPLLSAFIMVKHDPAKLVSSYRSAASAIVAIGLPLMIGQSLVADPTVRLLLGSKWLGAIPMVHWLAISLVPTLFGVLLTSLSMALNETKELVWRNLFQMSVKVPVVIVGAITFGFAGVIGARLVSEAVGALFCMIIVRRLIGISVRSQLMDCTRSVASVIVMACLLTALRPWIGWKGDTLMLIANLAVNVAIGAASYCGSLLALWIAMGKPPGIEAISVRALREFWKRFSGPLENAPIL
jgi:O-antigen/teichoic acid export membrane protein